MVNLPPLGGKNVAACQQHWGLSVTDRRTGAVVIVLLSLGLWAVIWLLISSLVSAKGGTDPSSGGEGAMEAGDF
jgi:hypothetical protein